MEALGRCFPEALSLQVLDRTHSLAAGQRAASSPASGPPPGLVSRAATPSRNPRALPVGVSEPVAAVLSSCLPGDPLLVHSLKDLYGGSMALSACPHEVYVSVHPLLGELGIKK